MTTDRTINQIFAYARVSTAEQNLDSQLKELRTVCSEQNIVTEKASGTNTTGRPNFNNLIDNTLRSGDLLYVQRLDRLARSTSDLLKIVGKLEKKGVDLIIMDNPDLDTTTSTGKMMFTILGAVAQFETDLRKERQLAGIEIAKAKGVYKGRKPLSEEKIIAVNELVESGKSVTQACKKVGIGKASYYRHIKAA
ncbi:recombinase family protein [Aliikangiella coralliicola]|uniref:Recombinase family protein n=1 Tax=Aliikangiella coralliicola TaxID=2592383 RepID=A0A545UD23_9GAMM|nr:recombinase family protein [Aliikangiella coralliicola]TQV87364.1 recombinase family protein [Aliikangiella coralliicola]